MIIYAYKFNLYQRNNVSLSFIFCLYSKTVNSTKDTLIGVYSRQINYGE